MMKSFIIFYFCVLFVACSSSSLKGDSTQLSFSNILKFRIDVTTENEIIAKLGRPTSKIQKSEHFVLNYDDLETGNQRLSLNIDSNNKKLIGFLWIPRSNDNEVNLEKAKSSFVASKYQEKYDEKNNHMLSTSIVSYIDPSQGITIRYDKRRSAVEAIAHYKAGNRATSSVNSK
jgi:hypothetical protein